MRAPGQKQVRNGQPQRVRPAAAHGRSVRGPFDRRPRKERYDPFGARPARRRSHQTFRRARAGQLAYSSTGILQVLGQRGRSGRHKTPVGKTPRKLFSVKDRQESDDNIVNLCPSTRRNIT